MWRAAAGLDACCGGRRTVARRLLWAAVRALSRAALLSVGGAKNDLHRRSPCLSDGKEAKVTVHCRLAFRLLSALYCNCQMSRENHL